MSLEKKKYIFIWLLVIFIIFSYVLSGVKSIDMIRSCGRKMALLSQILPLIDTDIDI